MCVAPAHVNRFPVTFMHLFFLYGDISDADAGFWQAQLQVPEGAQAFLEESMEEILDEQEQQEQEQQDLEFLQDEVHNWTSKLWDVAYNVAICYGLTCKLGERAEDLCRTPVADELGGSVLDRDRITKAMKQEVHIPCVSIPLPAAGSYERDILDFSLSVSDILDDTMLSVTLKEDELLVGGYQYSDVYSFRDYRTDMALVVGEVLTQHVHVHVQTPQ